MIGFSKQGFMIVSEGSKRKNFPDINSYTVGYSDILNLKSPGNGWHPFYMFQFRLNEVAYGITFSGEIRGLTISGSQPVITLAISKKFNLTGLFKPILSTYK